MDFTCIPPPPPEELEEVPPPPGTEIIYQSYGNSSFSANQSPIFSSDGMEWKRAVDALNQSVPSKPSVYGGGMYGSSASSLYSVPPPTWTANTYPYPSYTSSYPSSSSTGLYGGAPLQSNGSVYQRFATPMYSQPPASVPSNYNYMYSQMPVSQTVQTAQSAVVSSPRTGLVAKNRLARPKLSPYSMGTAQINKPGLLPTPQISEQSRTSSVPSSSAFSDDGVVDMQLDENPENAAETPRVVHKQAPEAGGVRFSLPNKKNVSGVKVSNPLLQSYRPGQRSQLSSNYSNPSCSTQSAEASSNSSEALGAVHSKDWPQSLQNYVAKAIERTPINKHEQVMHTITHMITDAYRTKTLYTVKWEDAPLPYSDNASNELFGLSPKSASQDSRTAQSDRHARREDFFHRTLRSGSESEQSTGESPRKGRVSKFSVASKWDSDDEEKADFIPLSVSKTTGRKVGKLKTGAMEKKAAAGPRTPKGKLMAFGAEEPKTAGDLEKLRLRQERFGDTNAIASTSVAKLSAKKTHMKPGVNSLRLRNQSNSRNQSALRTVVGTCTTVEKDYFRLTDAVDPTQVRPVHILERSLALVIEKWKKNHDYVHTESQLKSIRQDLRVQHVFSSFTVRVYETHARIALEVGDQAEFTQCLSQLEWLYETLMALERARKNGRDENAGKGPVAGCENRKEFLAYRILWVMRQNRATDATRVRSRLSDNDKKEPCIAFALTVLSAYFVGDYQQFFCLYKVAPLMSSYVMDTVIPQFRQKMFIKIATAYRPNLPVMALKNILCFNSDAEMRQFLSGYKLIYTWFDKQEEVDMKNSLPVIKAGPETAVLSAAAAKPSTPSVGKRVARNKLLATR